MREAKRPTICLSMIVKNESAVIRRCLRSVRPFIDAWAVSDTGSTDDTIAVVRSELAGLPGTLLERPWVDFSTNRNEALEAARGHGCDYILIIDADEELKPQPGFTLEELNADSYTAQFEIEGTGARWHRKLLLKSGVPWAYKGVLDEYLDDKGRVNHVLENVLVLSYTDGARSAEGLPAKFAKDVEVLKRACESDPTEPRNWFYLAQRLTGAGRIGEGLAAYRQRLALPGGWDEERFYSLYQIAQYRQELGDDWREVARCYLDAYQERPTRAEPLISLALLHQQHGETAIAEVYARAAMSMPRPNDSLLVHESVYAWLSADTLAGIMAQRGKLTEARNLLEKLLALPQVPKEQHERIRENIALIRQSEPEVEAVRSETLGPDEEIYAEQANTVARNGAAGLRAMARQFLVRHSMQALPSPTRWGWIYGLSMAPWLPVAAAIACLPLLAFALAPLVGVAAGWLGMAACAAAPLLHMLGRRKLQDTTVAALTLLAVGAAGFGDSVALGLATLALFACKEATVLVLPSVALAWWFGGASWAGFAIAVGAAGLTWFGVTYLLFGKMTLPLLRTAAAGHGTPYTLSQQRGAPHRLFVDLLLASPVTVLLAALGAAQSPRVTLIALTLFACHALAPVRNVRLVLAGELLLRGIGAALLTTLSWPIAVVIGVVWVASDAWILNKLRTVYDPTTSALAGELGMTRQSST